MARWVAERTTRSARRFALAALLGVLALGVWGAFAVFATPAPPTPTISSGPPNNTTNRSAMFTYAEAYGSTIAMGPQAMQGDITVNTGDWVAVGFHVSVPGQHPAATVTFDNNQFAFAVTCNDGSTPTQSTFTVTAPSTSISIPLNDSGSYPTASGQAAASYEGATQLPALCGTKAKNIRLKTGATFTSLLSSTDTIDKAQIQWHYVDTGAGKAAGNSINCSSQAANPNPGQAVCSGGWSGTLNTTAGTAQSSISFQCKLDSDVNFTTCGSGSASGTVTYPGPLTVGSHTFQVEAVVAGTPSSPASYTWAIIKNSPTLSLAGPGSPGTDKAGTAVPASSITATLASAYTPAGGAITFTVFGPGTTPSLCSSGGTTIGTPVSVSSNGVYHPNADFRPTAVGNYWLYASYPGDTNNNAANSTCPPGAAQEITVSQATPTLSVAASPGTGTSGTPIPPSAITATLGAASGSNAGGTITFKYFQQTSAPMSCAGGTTIGTTTSVSGNGAYQPTAGFTPSVAGSYWLYASYSGDTNNSSAASACSPVAKIVVGAASPTLTVSAPGNLDAGDSINATQLSATLSHSSGSNATSTITFKLFGPQATAPSTCASGGTTVGTTTPHGDGTYTASAGWTPDTAGTYWWYAASPADANNNAAASLCNSASMTKTVVASPSQQLSIEGDAVGTIYPGGPAQPIAITFHNPNNASVDVTSLTVTVGSTGVAGCSTSDFHITQSNITASNRFAVAGHNGSATIPASGPISRPTIEMVDSGDQSACKGAHLTLTYTSS